MRRSALNLSLALALGVGAAHAAEEGFAGLGSEAKGFAQVTPGKPIVFPRDFGAHDDYRTEWWYLTANLTDESGAAYGVQWTLFRQALAPQANADGWANGQLWMAHAAVTSGARHFLAEKFARGGVGQAGVEAVPFRGFIDDWFFTSGDDRLSRARIHAAGDSFDYDLALVSRGPLVLQGEAGYSRKSDGPQASYYFSQPFFSAEGVLHIEGREVKVSGSAWMDREWSSQPLAKNQKGWDWFSLHLDTGEKAMLFRLRDDTAQGFRSGTWIGADGGTQPLGSNDVELTPLAQTMIDNKSLTTKWRLRVPAHGLDIETSPVNALSWMKTSFPYWEGPISFAGTMKGVGYLEMTGAESEKPK